MKKLDCGVCGRTIGRRRHGAFYAHLFLGDAPSAWLRAGEPCPGSAQWSYPIQECEQIRANYCAKHLPKKPPSA